MSISTQPEQKGVALVHDAHEMRLRSVAIMRPLASPKEMIEAHKELAAIIAEALEEGRDYGKVPGTDKETLFKPGAERINIVMGCYARYTTVIVEVDHDRATAIQKKAWRNEYKGDRSFTLVEGQSFGLYRYVVKCEIVRRADDSTVGEGLGVCSTMESKYIDRPRDLENTIAKMGQKRALVAAVLNAFGLSDRFTQDAEDMADNKNASAASNTTTTAQDEREPERVPSMPFGDHKGKPITDPSVPLDVIVAAIEWASKDADLQKKFAVFIAAAHVEIIERVRDAKLNVDTLAKIVTWAGKNDKRRALFAMFIEKGEAEIERRSLAAEDAASDDVPQGEARSGQDSEQPTI